MLTLLNLLNETVCTSDGSDNLLVRITHPQMESEIIGRQCLFCSTQHSSCKWTVKWAFIEQLARWEYVLLYWAESAERSITGRTKETGARQTAARDQIVQDLCAGLASILNERIVTLLRLKREPCASLSNARRSNSSLLSEHIKLARSAKLRPQTPLFTTSRGFVLLRITNVGTGTASHRQKRSLN